MNPERTLVDDRIGPGAGDQLLLSDGLAGALNERNKPVSKGQFGNATVPAGQFHEPSYLPAFAEILPSLYESERRFEDHLSMAEESFVFGSFRLIPAQRILLEEGKPLRLGSRALDIRRTAMRLSA
jgi:hypothetical protein